jgi:AraC-like DNA-binding protein
MEIKLYKPANQSLLPYIESFYILKRNPEEKPLTYIAFPTTRYFVGFNANSKITGNERCFSINHSANKSLASNFIYNLDKPHFFQYKGETNEFNVCFKPLGLNAFLENDLSTYPCGYFTAFQPFPDYKNRIADILSVANDEDKIRAMESYWLSKFKGFEHPFLYKVIDRICDAESEGKTVERIAFDNGVSRVTLNNHFRRHLCTSAAQFKKIARFRRAMKKHSLKSMMENLADISYLVDYFDQSHMIKDFKSLTGRTPKSFFSKITPLENGEINWMFL